MSSIGAHYGAFSQRSMRAADAPRSLSPRARISALLSPAAMSFLSLLTAVLPVFLIIGAGYAIRRVNWLSAESDASLLRVVVNLLYPCLILDTILGNKALEQPGNILLAPAVGFASVVLGYGASWLAAPAFGLREGRARRTFAFTVGLYNYSYIPLPIIQKIFDAPTTAVLFIHNIGVEIALWTCGLLLISGGARAAPKLQPRRARLAPHRQCPLSSRSAAPWPCTFWAAVTGCPPGRSAPCTASAPPPSRWAWCSPVQRFAIRPATPRCSATCADSLGAILLRLGVLPVMMLALAHWLPAPVELRRVMLIQAAMPCAVIPVILCKHYGGDPAMALRIILSPPSPAC